MASLEFWLTILAWGLGIAAISHYMVMMVRSLRKP